MQKQKSTVAARIYRGVFYAAGLLILALGITLNTKTGMGVSPIISVSYSFSCILNVNFGNTTLVLYSLFVVIEMILHIRLYRRKVRGKRTGMEAMRQNRLQGTLIKDALQFPLSLAFTRFMNLFDGIIPELAAAYPGSFVGSFTGRLCFLILAIVLTGIGAAMSLDMRIIPNPGDGIVQAIADTVGKSVGLTKNCFDLTCILITICVSLLFEGRLIGIGIGTVLAVIGVGRSIALFNHICLDKMLELAGMKNGIH